MERYRDQAEMLGALQTGRKLLECPWCGLHEDELADLSLIVATEEDPRTDSGLRFQALDDDPERWLCPGCQSPFP